jgi:hypothetical protein
MHGKICGVLALVAVAGLALPGAGQAARSRIANVEMGNSARAAQLPYTAEYRITRVKTLADGSTITQESTEVVAVDSQGRRMESTTTVPQSADQTPRTHVSVFDPAPNTHSSWSVPGHDVSVTMLTLGMPNRGCSIGSVSTGPVRGAVTSVIRPAKPIVEDLGTETIQGVEARGRRTTSTTPAGALGNNEPLVHSNETWTAIDPGLRRILARQVSDDPQSGKMTKELTNFSQAEPEAAIFQPPPDYEIVTREALSDPCADIVGRETPAVPAPPPAAPPEQ